jgi:hypothetical protein
MGTTLSNDPESGIRTMDKTKLLSFFPMFTSILYIASGVCRMCDSLNVCNPLFEIGLIDPDKPLSGENFTAMITSRSKNGNVSV